MEHAHRLVQIPILRFGDADEYTDQYTYHDPDVNEYANSTNTPTNTPTSTRTPTNTPTRTNTPTNTPTRTPTNTPTGTNTPAGTATPTNTPTSTPTTTSLVTRTFVSVAAQDGWILESGETTNTGGSINAAATTFRLGDDASKRQYRSILSFGTGSLPDNAVLTSVTLKIRKAGQAGANPFGTLGNIVVDIRKGAFNSNAALESADFQAGASKNIALSIVNNPVNGWYSRGLSSANFGYINLAGVTQMRLRFALDDNNNLVADYLTFYSGDFSTTPANRPVLVIKYHLP